MSDELAYTSVQTIAEILQSRIEPAMRASGNYEFEDICEEVRNAYAGVLWKVHMANMSDGDRTALESSIVPKSYPATPDTKSIKLTGIMIIDLPRDAGIYDVSAYDKDNVALAKLTKTTPAGATAPKSKLDPGKRYYRMGGSLYFPDGLPDCTASVLVCVYGLDTTDLETIQRDYADLVRDKVWNSLFPSKQVPADITNNQNTNQ